MILTPVHTQRRAVADVHPAGRIHLRPAVCYHLDYQTLRDHVHNLHARRIVLTHLSTSMLDGLTGTDFPAAHDGMTIDI